jgi:methyl-accepting chemotaxis protein
MKGTLKTALVLMLNVGALWLPVSGMADNTHDSAAEDVLIKSEVETAVSMLQAIADKQQRGEMTLEQAEKLGADLLRELRYGHDGYFWADTTDGINVVLYGRKDVEGKNRLEAKDRHGTHYIKQFIITAKAGGGYVEYWFPKLGQSTAQPKRSYVLLFKPFQWVVGSGYYP